MSRYAQTVRVPCPQCGERVAIELQVDHDPGCWRTKNGDGWPESWSYDVISEKCEECGFSVDESWDAAIDDAFSSHRPDRDDYAKEWDDE